MKWPLLFCIVLAQLFLIAANSCLAAAVNPDTHWSGDVEIESPFEVPIGNRLEIDAGTRVIFKSPLASLLVSGELIVSGSPKHPVIFVGIPGATAISFLEKSLGEITNATFSQFDFAVLAAGHSLNVDKSSFSGCGQALRLLKGVNADISASLFENNRIGLNIEMRTFTRVSGNIFKHNSEYGISIGSGGSGLVIENSFQMNNIAILMLRNKTGEIYRNSFEGNKIGINAIQSGGKIQIIGNSFNNNDLSISGESYAYPEISGNNFVENLIAIEGKQYFYGYITHNVFERNGTSLQLTKRSFPEVSFNSFVGGKLSIFLDYSSYPKVNFNNFEMADNIVRLGMHQSADWEAREGSSSLVFKRRQDNQKGNAEKQDVRVPIQEELDFTRNWWGRDNIERLKAREPNQDFLFDRRDLAYLTFESNKTEKYKLDLINFEPWEDSPVAGAGQQ